ncbi:MAG TPA: ABC transporter permease [Rhizomicrobium sp.]|jgi:putative ABC transport system permease protein|nr:ABC transporter permease [Rhizomicrobium sp.]
MLHNWLVTALRNFARHRLYSFINIAGMAVGLACAIFIILFLRDELSYDSWIPGTKNVYRVEGWFYFPGRGIEPAGAIPFPVTPAMLAQIPEVEAQTHLINKKTTVNVGNRQFSESVDFVDPGFFRIIRLPLIAGDPARVFAQPESVVLSQTLAQKYFGGADPVGKTIVVDAKHPLTVTGVLRDLPHNTQLYADMVVPNTSGADPLPLSEKREWLNIDGFGYVRLAPGANPNTVLGKLKPILDRNVDAGKEEGLHIPGSQLLQVHMTPFRDVHLTSDKYGGMKAAGSWTTIYGFAAIAALILAIACFNFMNLATARAMMRAREVSLRKVVGAKRVQLIVQFLGESVLTALIALFLAFAVVEVLLPLYDGFLDRPIVPNYLADWPLSLSVLGIAVAAGLLGGFYPALVLSGYRPAAVLKPAAGSLSGSGLLRTALVVLQFAISIALGTAALVVFAQIRHARQIDLGFDRDNVVIVSGANDLTPSAREDFAHALAADPAIDGVAQSGPVPFVRDIQIENVDVPGRPETLSIRTIDMGFDFPTVYRMRLLAGRQLSASRGDDTNRGDANDGFENDRNVLISAAAARRFGYGIGEAPGKTIDVDHAHMTIVGVLGDAKMEGALAVSEPLIFYNNPVHIDSFSIRIKAGQTQAALAAIDRTWHQFAPTVAISRHFLNQFFDRLFATDVRQGAMFGVFVGIAIFIACLGLFGLAAFTAERRTREIGVRKVFGARTRDLVGLLVWQFSIPVLIANAIAWPVAWYWLHNWLESYAYRIALSPLYFLAAGAAALVIAWLTVIGHSLTIARANPIHALRYE